MAGAGGDEHGHMQLHDHRVPIAPDRLGGDARVVHAEGEGDCTLRIAYARFYDICIYIRIGFERESESLAIPAGQGGLDVRPGDRLARRRATVHGDGHRLGRVGRSRPTGEDLSRLDGLTRPGMIDVDLMHDSLRHPGRSSLEEYRI